MGYEANAYLCIGSKVSMKDLTEFSQERGCNHPKTEDSFCAKCGAKTWVEKTTRMDIDTILEGSGLNYLSPNPDSDFYYVGRFWTVGVYDLKGFDAVPLIAQIQDIVPAATDFGYHVILEESY